MLTFHETVIATSPLVLEHDTYVMPYKWFMKVSYSDDVPSAYSVHQQFYYRDTLRPSYVNNGVFLEINERHNQADAFENAFAYFTNQIDTIMRLVRKGEITPM